MLRTALNPSESQTLPPHFRAHFQERFVTEPPEEPHSSAAPTCLNKPNGTSQKYPTEPFTVATWRIISLRNEEMHHSLQSSDSLLLQGSVLALIFTSSELLRSVWLPTIFHICITVHSYNPPLPKIPRQYCNVKWKANVCWLKALQRTVPAAGRHLAMRQHLSVSGAAQWDSLAMQGMQMLSPRAFFFVVKVTVTVVLWARGHSRKTTLLLTSHIFIMGQSRILTSALRLHSQHTRQKAEGWKPKWPTTDTQV